MELRYGLDERPPPISLILFGLQWLATALPGIILIGSVVAALHFPDPAAQLAYLQKISLLTGIALAAQVLVGHRLPLVIGPAAVLLVGVVSSQGATLPAIYTAILVGGLLLALMSATGIFARLQPLFTPRVVAVILLLIAFTLAPTMLRLLTVSPPGRTPLASLLFGLVLIGCLFILHRHLSGLWRSTLIVWGMAAGSFVWFLLFPSSPVPGRFSPPLLGFFPLDFPGFAFDPGVMTAFLICTVALAVNDLGSIQAMDPLLRPSAMPERLRRGMVLTGLANACSGLFGVVGPVNFSLSPGVIASTGCASRFTLLPAALGLAVLSLSPASLSWLGRAPQAVIGAVLVYILSAQVAAGLQLLSGGELKFQQGLTVGLPLLLGTMIAFLPAEVAAAFPAALRPVLGNGFVVGTGTVLILEHLIFRE